MQNKWIIPLLIALDLLVALFFLFHKNDISNVSKIKKTYLESEIQKKQIEKKINELKEDVFINAKIIDSLKAKKHEIDKATHDSIYNILLGKDKRTSANPH